MRSSASSRDTVGRLQPEATSRKPGRRLTRRFARRATPSVERFLSPGLMTVSRSLQEMRKVACELTLSAVVGDPVPQAVKLRTELEIRGSMGPAPPRRKARHADVK